MYEVQFEVGTFQAYSTNLIAENMMQRTVNDEGYHEDTLHSIVDVRSNSNAVQNTFIYDRHGKRRTRQTTASVNLLVAVKDGVNLDDGSKKVSNKWIPLKDMKKSHPVGVAKVAVARGVDKMLALSGGLTMF